jgi:hypothetical protein
MKSFSLIENDRKGRNSQKLNDITYQKYRTNPNSAEYFLRCFFVQSSACKHRMIEQLFLQEMAKAQKINNPHFQQKLPLYGSIFIYEFIAYR